MTSANNTTLIEATYSKYAERSWSFAGSFIFKIESTLIAVINIFAFYIIFKNDKCFGKNGFREQLLIMCVNDIVSGVGFFCFTFCLEKEDCSTNLLYGFVGVFTISQCLSFGNTLGISLQRFLATRRAGDTRPGWTRRYTAIYCVLNLVIMLSVMLLYVMLNIIRMEDISNIFITVVISLYVIVTDTLCCLTLYYLNKNMKTVSAGWTSRSRGNDATKDGSSDSNINYDMPKVSASTSTHVQKDKGISTLSVERTSSTHIEKDTHNVNVSVLVLQLVNKMNVILHFRRLIYIRGIFNRYQSRYKRNS